MKTKHFFLLLVNLILFNSVFGSETSGTILSNTQSQALVCKDSSCTPATAGKINFKPTTISGINPVSITDSGITGHAFGNQLGWILMNPSGSGVTVNANTGALSGHAFSQSSGYINFNPTAPSGTTTSQGIPYGVTINSSGQFYGWAWASGSSGGWVKFDCSVSSNAACVVTDWRPVPNRTVVSGGGGGGGGGGGSIVSNPNGSGVDSSTSFSQQSGPQNQRNGDYTNRYRADINDGGRVEVFDFNQMMVNWASQTSVDLGASKQDRCRTSNVADLNCDGKVNVFDFNILMVEWGKAVTGN
jgi:hypothetical protein